MSMTSMLSSKNNINNTFVELMKEVIPKKEDFVAASGNPAFWSKREILCPYPYKKEDRGDASLCGIAFDYLARLMIAQKVKNGESFLNALVSETGVQRIKYYNPEIYKKAIGEYEKGKKNIKKYLGINQFRPKIFGKRSGKDIDEIIPDVIYWAKLDALVRGGFFPCDLKQYLFSKYPQTVFIDLQNLCAIFREKFLPTINENSCIVFNPTFGVGSMLVGGADGDIYIDGTLYDFKSSKLTGYAWKEVAQITGYYYLDRIAKAFNDSSASLHGLTIDRIAFYRARFGEIEYYNISDRGENENSKITQQLMKFFGQRSQILNNSPIDSKSSELSMVSNEEDFMENFFKRYQIYRNKPF